jgi:hypothetical protein
MAEIMARQSSGGALAHAKDTTGEGAMRACVVAVPKTNSATTPITVAIAAFSTASGRRDAQKAQFAELPSV